MRYDVIIIGAGPGGYVSAIRLGQLGKKVLVIEKKYIGGVCLNEGCIPAKTLIYASYLREKINYAKREMGLNLIDEGFDIDKLRKWKDKVVERLTKGIESLWKHYNIEWIKGEGKLIDKSTVLVMSEENEKYFEADYIILATGSKPSFLPFLQPDKELVWTSTEAISLQRIPSKIIVIGAGAIGLEFAYVYRYLGSEVEIYEIMPQILPGSDKEMSDELRKILNRKGIKIFLEAKVKGAERGKDGIELIVELEGEEERKKGDVLLLSVGRAPDTSKLNLEEVGVQKNERGFIITDNQMRTSVPNIFAIGDVAGPPLLAHKASKQGIVSAEVIAGLPSKFEPRSIPNVVYTEPQFASVGLSEEEVKDKGINYSVGRFPFIANGKSVSCGETSGLVKIIAESTSGRILGIHILGPDASSLIGEGLLAHNMMGNVEEIADAIHPHPSLSEAIMEAGENCLRKAIHILNK
ncbi:MAG: dihydrolipoyl dehydrogenase [Candidatus Aminicenantia bacterium]